MTTPIPDGEPMTFIAPELMATEEDVRVGNPIALAASRCESCGRVDFPRRDSCSACRGDVAEHSLTGPARLGNRTAVLHAPPGAAVGVPYEIGVAEFPEGIAVMGLLLGGDAVVRGAELDVVSAQAGDRLTYAFQPTASAGANPSQDERN